VTTPPTPTPPVPDDDQLVRSLAPITFAFSSALVLVGLLGVFVLVPDPTVTPGGLVIGGVLALISWFVPTAVIRNRLANAARQPVAPELVPALVRAIVMIGLSLAEAPALLGLVFAVSSGTDVGPLVLSVPLAIASLVVNVSGPGAVRRHLERLRSTLAY
jgi:F0F1-type ATP synthase membrane subunit c/vacuolar-type H+-ATPase subunit K